MPRDERTSKERTRSFFPFLGGPLVPAKAPGKSFQNQRWPPKWPPARIPTFLQCPVAASMRAAKFHKRRFDLFPKNPEKQTGATKTVASSNPSIFKVSRGHFDEGRNALDKKLLRREVCLKTKKTLFEVGRGCHLDGRQTESLHFYRLPCDGPNRVIFTV